MELIKSTLSKLKDNEEFKLSKRSDVIYEKVKKEKDGIVFTSTISNRSFKRKGSTVVWKVCS